MTKPNQTGLPERLQEIVREQAALLFPDCCAPVPGLVALPAGIHPYNRAAAYYDPSANLIVLYQKLGRLALGRPDSPWLLPTIQHELCHWYQEQELGYFSSPAARSTTNCHRVASWSEACWVASKALFPEADLDRQEFNYRRKKGPHLSDVGLHHFPRSMRRYLAGRGEVPDASTWQPGRADYSHQSPALGMA